jgi:hypothetical protein
VLAHVAVLVVVPFCLLAGWWQLDRARSGNSISWGYAIQWPIFAAVALIMWWQLVHDKRPEASDPDSSAKPVATRRRDVEDAALRDYNDQLEFLGAFGRRKTWRNPTGSP